MHPTQAPASLQQPPPSTAPDAPTRSGDAGLRGCPDCGLMQHVPHPPPGAAAHCPRCDTMLRRGRRDPFGPPLALGLAGISLLFVAVIAPMLDVSTAGIDRKSTLLTGPEGLGANGLWELSVVVLFTTIAAPLLHLIGTTWVLLTLRGENPPPRAARRVFAWMQRLRPWSMIEVYLVGVFVAYTKLRQIVHIEIGPALWALIALMVIVIVADYFLDGEAVWRALDRAEAGREPSPTVPRPARVPAPSCVTCEVCSLVADGGGECPRCGSRLHRRKPDSIARAWALSLAALVLYIPANTYPVLTFIRLGNGEPSTILGGARELLDGGQWPLALIVFVASIAVPVLKLIGLFLMLATTQRGVAGRLHDRTLLYRIVEAIGRWSMIDIFMESILVALVQFGGLVAIEPGVGAVAFAAVVILTMLAAECFDPRLMWDAAGLNPFETPQTRVRAPRRAVPEPAE